MERVASDERFRAIRQTGRGVVYNDVSRIGASGAQYNIVHAASCRWLNRSSLTVPKVWFEDLVAARDWLVRERGREGARWKRCGTCHGTSASGETPSALRPSPHAHEAVLQEGAPGAYVVLADPGCSWVEAWSESRLPFEPTGRMREFRDELRGAVATMSAGPSEALHAIYTSPVEGRFDVENVLLYNVGTRAFANATANEIVVERVLGPVPGPPAELAGAHHYHRYEIVASQDPWRGWSAVRPLASFGPLDLEPSGRVIRPAPVWYALRRSGTRVSSPAVDPSRFGLDLVLETSAHLRVNLASIAKPFVDGVIAAFHTHDHSPSLDLVASRVSAQLGVSVAEIRGHLRDDRTAILGARTLLWPWRDGVQWNPADDRCLALRIRRVARAAVAAHSAGVRLVGSLVEIEPRRSPVA